MASASRSLSSFNLQMISMILWDRSLRIAPTVIRLVRYIIFISVDGMAGTHPWILQISAAENPPPELWIGWR